ncbi:MAG TPA: acetolactate decarboxylase [Phycisphaerae bacterium]|nr:acetolactate decarboxylase [Phycisphaerae bacterium]HRW54712.1 acetolactate decarboxylase [Phycisphaerae bacterium]
MTTRKLVIPMSVAWLALAPGCATHSIDVAQYGQMHRVLSGGGENATGIVGVGEALEKPNAIGVGALAGLEGEITIRDGRAWIARPEQGQLHVDGPMTASDDRAALMTVAYVDSWREIPIDRDLAGEDLEMFIRQCAASNGIDTSRPFPFMLDGRVSDLEIHVINGECPMRPGGRLTADQAPWRWTADHAPNAQVVGFFASDSVGRMTHPGTSIHAHAIVRAKGREVTGHIERIAMARGSVLKLPLVQ